MQSDNRGIVYVSFGKVFNRYTKISIRTLRKEGRYLGSIRLLTAQPADFSRFQKECEIIAVGHDNGNDFFHSRFFKTQLNVYGFRETIFIDSDCLIRRPIAPIWDYLDNYKIALALNRRRIANLSKDLYPPREVLLMEKMGLLDRHLYNGGVLVFKKTGETDKFFKEWHEEWLKFKEFDQFALIRALSKTNIVPGILNGRFNYQFTNSTVPKDVVIIHCLDVENKSRIVYGDSFYLLIKLIGRIKGYIFKCLAGAKRRGKKIF